MRPERPSSSEDPEARQREQLATFLVVMLTLLVGGSFLVFLIVVTLGLFLWVIVAAGVIAVFTAFHYLLWGRSSHLPKMPDESERTDGPVAPRRRLPDGPASSSDKNEV